MPHATVALDNESGGPVQLYYEVHGSGQHRILFISGFGNICHQWDLQVKTFGIEAADMFSVCIFDNRGSGFSSSPPGRYTTKMMAMDARDLVNQLQWDTFHVVGISMGGMIAQELSWLLRNDRRILSLTLESTVAYFNGLPLAGYWGLVFPPKFERTVENFAMHVVENLIFPKDWLDAKSTLVSDYASETTNREFVLRFMIERFERTGLQDPKGRASQQSAAITHSMSFTRLQHLRDAQIPVLVITGDNDNVLLQPSSSLYLARALGGRCEVFRGGGHAIRLQFPEKHDQLLKDHVLAAARIWERRAEHARLVQMRNRRSTLPISLGATADLITSHVPHNIDTEVDDDDDDVEFGWIAQSDPMFPDVVVERHVISTDIDFLPSALISRTISTSSLNRLSSTSRLWGMFMKSAATSSPTASTSQLNRPDSSRFMLSPSLLNLVPSRSSTSLSLAQATALRTISSDSQNTCSVDGDDDRVTTSSDIDADDVPKQLGRVTGSYLANLSSIRFGFRDFISMIPGTGSGTGTG